MSSSLLKRRKQGLKVGITSSGTEQKLAKGKSTKWASMCPKRKKISTILEKFRGENSDDDNLEENAIY
jgi:hypothetical protein